MSFIRELADIGGPIRSSIKYRSLLWQLVKRNIAVRYRGSMLGLIWSLVQPMMMLCVYTFVFSTVLKSRWGVEQGDSRGAFAIIMFCGIAIFNIFSESVGIACNLIVGNTNLVKKVIFPLEILPLAQTLSTFILGTVWFVLLFLGVVFIFGKISFTMLLLPLILLPLFMFTLGVSYLTASLGVYVRDTAYVVQVILQILFFMTPIFYPLEKIPPGFQGVIRINPLAILIDQARKIFIYGTLPSWQFLGVAFLISLLVMHLGFVWFNKTKKGFADVL